MVKKLGRRYFLGKVSAAVVGGTVLISSCGDQAGHNKKASSEDQAEVSGNKIEENRQMPRDLVMKMLDQKADKYMHISFNCAQSSFLALQEQFGLEGDDILKALTPLTGIAERGETCGAVTGALMVFGLLYGRGKTRLNDWDSYRASLIPSGEFCTQFEKKYGSTMCCRIQEKKFGRCFRLMQPDDLKEFQEEGATDKCTKVVQDALRMAANIILDNKESV
jgi:C_GCAxxG_C_C family probable redox protein